VALSAFDSFCRGAAAGRFPRLDDRDNLWRVLVVITARKAGRLRRDERRLKRGGGAEALPLGDEDVQQILSQEPTPEFAAQASEECSRLLRLLGDADLEARGRCGRWKATATRRSPARLGRAPRSVERKLRFIREVWDRQGQT